MLTDTGGRLLANIMRNEPTVDFHMTLHDIARDLLTHGDIRLDPGDTATVRLEVLGAEVCTVDVRMRERDPVVLQDGDTIRFTGPTVTLP